MQRDEISLSLRQENTVVQRIDAHGKRRRERLNRPQQLPARAFQCPLVRFLAGTVIFSTSPTHSGHPDLHKSSSTPQLSSSLLLRPILGILFRSGTVVFYSNPFCAFRPRLVLVHAGIVIFSKSMTHSKPNR